MYLYMYICTIFNDFVLFMETRSLKNKKRERYTKPGSAHPLHPTARRPPTRPPIWRERDAIGISKSGRHTAYNARKGPGTGTRERVGVQSTRKAYLTKTISQPGVFLNLCLVYACYLGIYTGI